MTTTTTMTLSPQRLSEEQAVCDSVALIWGRSDSSETPLFRTIYLKNLNRGNASSSCMSSRSNENAKDDNTKEDTAEVGKNSEEPPFSVLEFERKKRKEQHEKKVGIKPTTLDVVYADEEIVVVNKPPGVLSVPGLNQHTSVTDLVHERYGTYKDGTVTEKDHMVVHRLDMDTSGLLVFGRSLSITKQLHTQFRTREVSKEYRAVVMGQWPIDFCTEGLIDLPLQRDIDNPPFMRVSTPKYQAHAYRALEELQNAGWKKLMKQNPKPSQTEFHVLTPPRSTTTSSLPYTHLRLIPVTGRTHQLRVHCAALGFPIVGDSTYSLYGEAAPRGGLGSLEHVLVNEMNENFFDGGGTPVPRPSFLLQKEWTEKYPPNIKPMCLHAARLSFVHPTRQDETMCFENEPNFDEYFKHI